MAFPVLASTSELLNSLENSGDIVSWINGTLTPSNEAESSQPEGLTELDQHITHLVATLDIACEDTSSQLERIIDEVSRSVPRLAYDLHFMKDGASSLQSVLVKVHERSRDVVPQDTRNTLNNLQQLDTIKGHMEAAREVLREAESWSTLELEVTSLLAERSYAKAAERLAEASRSMVVFQNTPEYDPRRMLMVNLQNQLEAALSSALVAAINVQDLVACRSYFSIFSVIHRESEFRNYYNGSRRGPVVTMWQDSRLVDSDPASSDVGSVTFADFLPKFYANFLSLLNVERTSIPSIFPDPVLTLSNLITSVLSALQPTFSQRLAALSSHYADSALKEIIPVFRATEEFASGVEKVVEKLRYSAAITSPMEGSSSFDGSQPIIQTHVRRRSTRLSMSWRSGPHRPSSSGLGVPKSQPLSSDDLEWDQELFQPFIDFQVDYGSLERRLLDHVLREIISNDSRARIPEFDQARLLRERAVDVFSVAEESIARCASLTYGYGAVGLVQALDGFFRSFIDMWTADIRMQSSSTSVTHEPVSEEDLFDLDYTAQDWSDFQLSLHLLSSARAVFEHMSQFEAKLRSNLVRIATRFRLAQTDPANFVIAPCKGENQLLEQSALNSAELHALLDRVEPDPSHSRETFSSSSTAGLRHGVQPYVQPGSPAPLLVEARDGVFAFAKACQISLQGTILAPLRKHLASYASSLLWTAQGDPKSKRVNDLQVPSFSLSPSDGVQKVAEGLLNLPRLFEVYADDDALSFSLHTLPHLDPEVLKGLSDFPAPVGESLPPLGHQRRQSLSTSKPTPVDPEAVSSAWLSSLGQTLLTHLTTDILPNITTLTVSGAAQLASDLGYLSNIVRALNVEFEDLDKWKEYADLDDDEGRKRLGVEPTNSILKNVAKMRGWDR